MRVLLVATSMTTGGVQGVVGSLANHLHRLGHIVRVVSIHEVDIYQTDAGVERIQLNCARNAAGRMICVWKLRQQVRQFRPDVVHSHAFHANFFSSLAVAGGGRKTPLVRTVHSVREGGRAHARIFRALRVFSAADSVVSTAVGDSQVSLGGLPADGYSVIRNGIDTVRFSFDPAERKKVRSELSVGPKDHLLINVGRMTEAKDHAILLASFQLVSAVTPSARLALVGAGEIIGEVEELVRRLGLTDRVFLLGERDDVPHLLSAADLFVLSSAWEGYPLCVLEARACGLPVVAFPVGGVAEALEGWGELVHERTARALAESVNGQIRRSQVVRSSSQARGISIEAMVSQWVDLYTSVACEVRSLAD